MLYEITAPHFTARLLFWRGIASYGDDAIQFMAHWSLWQVIERCRTEGWLIEQKTGNKIALPSVSEFVGAPINHVPALPAKQEKIVMTQKPGYFSSGPKPIERTLRPTPVELADAVLKAKEHVAVAEKAYADEIALRKAEEQDAANKLNAA